MSYSALQIIAETVTEYATTPARRAWDRQTDSYQFKTDDGRLCPFGRCLKYPDSYKGNVFAPSSILETDGQEILKVKYQGKHPKLWDHLTLLHDNSAFWTSTGLSLAGNRYVDELLTKADNGEYDLLNDVK